MSLNIRSVLELFCSILSENGITCLKAETFRQAKFNDDRATEMMWKALLDTAMFYQDAAFTITSQAESVRFVKSCLQNWGYLSKCFAELPEDMTRGSRELLLALGWVIHSKDIVGKIISKRSSPLHKKVDTFHLPSDLSSLLPNPMKIPSRTQSSRQQLHRQIMMCGKFKMSLRRLYASLQQAAKLKREIHSHTTGVSLQPELDHLTPLEVYLLRYPNCLKDMYQQLTKDNEQLKNLLDWKGKDHVFWEWMDSVLTLHLEEAQTPRENDVDSRVTDSVFLSVPVSIGDNITQKRSELREFILQHEEDMYRLDEILKNKKVSYEELEIATFQSEKEIAELNKRFAEDASYNDEKGSSMSTSTSHSQSRSTRAGHSNSQSFQSVKRNKKAEILEMVKEEVTSLKQKVSVMESDLKQMQLNNVHKLQGLMSEDEGSICILPRYFKQFANI